MRIISPLVFAVFASLLVTGVGCSSSTDPAKPAANATATADNQQLPSDETLKKQLDEAIEFTKARRLSAERHNAWQIVHGILAFTKDFEIKTGDKTVAALDYLLKGGEIRGWTMRPGDHGLESIVESGTKSGQGHEDQWIGYCSQCGLSPDDKIVVRGQEFKINDLLTQAQWDLYPGMEATWTLMALSSYLPEDAMWKSKDGTEWTVEKIAEMEAQQDLSESACGGTHRLYGLGLALTQHLARGGKLTGGWATADAKVKGAIEAAKRNQQPDGTFSTSFFERPGTSPDIAVVMHATGHTFEFLTLVLSDEQLREPWMKRAAVALCNLFEETRDMDVECGALYHAAHGLVLYRDRVFGQPTVANGG